MLSGCRVMEINQYKISGRVTEADGAGIPAVRINYTINRSRHGSTVTDKNGDWWIWVDEGNWVKISAQKEDYMFAPAPYPEFRVTGNKQDVNFKVISWYDDFTDTNNGWFVGKFVYDDDDDSYASITAKDEYELHVDNRSNRFASSVKSAVPLAIPHSYEIGVTGYPCAEDTGMYGLVFNVKSYNGFAPGNFYYVFRVRPEEEYYELIRVNITGDNYTNTTKITGGKSRQIDIAGTNRLAVRQNVNMVDLCVNGEVLRRVSIEEQKTSSIKAGLYAYADPYSTYTVCFDNFYVIAMGITPENQTMNAMSMSSLSTYSDNWSKDVEIAE